LGVRRGVALLCLTAVLACATPGNSPTERAVESVSLKAALVALPGSVDPVEAGRLARAAIDAVAELRHRYRPLRPPQLGNLAFHLGLRERALCFHWVEDLLHALRAVDAESFELHWGVAHFGSQLREHSALVVVPQGGSFDRGLVLDAWRHSGRLHWSRLDRDVYPWRLHPSDGVREQLACGASGSG
jgi:hypothetical protein